MSSFNDRVEGVLLSAAAGDAPLAAFPYAAADHVDVEVGFAVGADFVSYLVEHFEGWVAQDTLLGVRKTFHNLLFTRKTKGWVASPYLRQPIGCNNSERRTVDEMDSLNRDERGF